MNGNGMGACIICGQQASLCGEHKVCLACHEIELRHLVTERNQAHQYIAMLQGSTYDSEPQPQPRTLGSRVIGSMWDPSNPNETDDIPATCRSIERFLTAASQT